MKIILTAPERYPLARLRRLTWSLLLIRFCVWCAAISAPSGVVCRGGWRARGRITVLCGLGRAPGHPDEGMKPAVGDVLEAFHLLKPRSLVHGNRPAI
jgi:hypothetical protein